MKLRALADDADNDFVLMIPDSFWVNLWAGLLMVGDECWSEKAFQIAEAMLEESKKRGHQ